MNMTPQDIIIKPILTEKSSGDVAVGKYTFEVNKTATKTQIPTYPNMPINLTKNAVLEEGSCDDRNRIEGFLLLGQGRQDH